MLAGDGRAVELRHDEAVAADAGEPETALGIGGELQSRRDRDPREILLLELDRSALSWPWRLRARGRGLPRPRRGLASTWRVAPGTGFPSRSTIWPVIGRSSTS